MIYRICPFGHLLVQLLAAFVSCWHIVYFTVFYCNCMILCQINLIWFYCTLLGCF